MDTRHFLPVFFKGSPGWELGGLCHFYGNTDVCSKAMLQTPWGVRNLADLFQHANGEFSPHQAATQSVPQALGGLNITHPRPPAPRVIAL
jgi:hypothetical protein